MLDPSTQRFAVTICFCYNDNFSPKRVPNFKKKCYRSHVHDFHVLSSIFEIHIWIISYFERFWLPKSIKFSEVWKIKYKIIICCHNITVWFIVILHFSCYRSNSQVPVWNWPETQKPEQKHPKNPSSSCLISENWDEALPSNNKLTPFLSVFDGYYI